MTVETEKRDPDVTPLLRINDLTRTFTRRGKPFDAVSHVSLDLDAGGFVAIVGRSGNGKSTLINMVAGLVRPTGGSVAVDGARVADLDDRGLSLLRNRTIGFVTQEQTLLGNLPVLDNVILPATFFPDGKAGSEPSGERGDGEWEGRDPLVDRAMLLLERLGVDDLAGCLPRELSGGEMRRVSIARALINDPKLIIADEPTGDLDADSTTTVMRLLRERADSGAGVLMVTHDTDAIGYADTVYRMDAGTLSRA
ncbi:ABC transporter ATP-binding protein [Bifidobacterium stellenboschense]|uniref:ABC transporter ATP-binding protein n=1 Tax=Bifidobacterium stellenboschense TaxID=762211 RepID=A0A087DPA9_9BIFI|nr:ABC transporter ATP-binding protein [Bifidobacterium stellenboschense]KFI97359.1 ABC transporter ATP-binding protein [Bifidobacterium stellenboschense]